MHFFPHTVVTFLCSFVVMCAIFEPLLLAPKKKKLGKKVSFTTHWCIIQSKDTVFSKFVSIFPVFPMEVAFLYFVFKRDVTKLNPYYTFSTALIYMKVLQYRSLWRSLRWNKMTLNKINFLNSCKQIALKTRKKIVNIE